MHEDKENTDKDKDLGWDNASAKEGYGPIVKSE
jgi:hypothetical protein